ncbi:hypothetical protein OOK29_26160 [Streptomyces phaeochromogenes]|uniref:hypothetical protein n=1 Tax=Streptomyces phaeochromogenes TaxID=1923 RepID=UPI00224FA17B|nr:hypothetical protein [Streptomyces phaeochromogenes]MCX5601640.1 hypothetical protein [Streptomyces phaeochromogenes]
MEPSSWLGLLAVVVSTGGSAWGAWLGRTRTTVQDVPASSEGVALPAAPAQPTGTWTVSPEMYAWFQEQMAGLHTRMRSLEDLEKESRSRADRTERLLGKALDHISQQDDRLQEAGIPLVPMDPELISARDSR